jgi:hypothetical protein
MQFKIIWNRLDKFQLIYLEIIRLIDFKNY